MKHQQKSHIDELPLPPIGKFRTQQPSSTKKLIFLILFFTTLTTLPLYLRTSLPTTPPTPLNQHTCNLFNGTWVPHSRDPYYTNDTCNMIIDQQNCLKFGRQDSDYYLKWKWQPDQCELPYFDALSFLELVRGKSLAFLGDSVGKNQMHSLYCLLASVENPEDVSERYANDTSFFKRYIYHEYNFTMGTLWAPFLVRAVESDPNGYSPNSQMNLYLDEPSEGWYGDVASFDYVIVSAGQWFFRPVVLHENGSLVGCSYCGLPNMTSLTPFYVYRRAFRTVFDTLLSLKDYKGVTFLRTFSPSHFENGAWNAGGSCTRTQPFGRDVEAPFYVEEMHRMQVEEFEGAKEVAKKRGLDFRIMDTTKAMLMRPDGHPNYYGRSPHRNMSYADCVHWCLPGPIDAWNEIFLHMLRAMNTTNPILDGNI